LADLLYGIATSAAPTSTGDQTFTDSNFGGTPKLALFFINSATADSTVTAHNRFGMGAADGTTEACVLLQDQDNVGTSEANRFGTTTKCIAILNTSAATIDGEADFKNFTNNTVTITWTDAPATAVLVTCVMFGGDDFSGAVDAIALSASVDTEVTVTPGLDPESVILMYGDEDLDRTGNIFARYSLGFCVDDGSATQRAHNFDSADNADTSETKGQMLSDRAAASVGGNDEIEVTSFTSTTFGLTTRASGSGESIIAISMNNGGEAVDVGDFPTPTTVSTRSVTTTEDPGFVLTLNSLLASLDSVGDTGRASIGISMITENDSYSISNTSRDNVGTTETHCYVEDGRYIAYDQDGTTIKYEGAASVGTAKFEIAFASVDATARQVSYISFPKGDGGSPPAGLVAGSLNLMGVGL